jgi:hypothetical protein
MKIVSFALFGADPKYRRGMMANVRAAGTHYPGWRLLIYCDRINHDALMQEDLGPDTECILQKERSDGVEGMSWRFLAVLRPDADAVIFRDADSIFTHREQVVVNEWLASACDTHIIRDHPYHQSPVMGGLLGVRGPARQLLASLVQERMASHRLTEYGDDQVFLTRDFYPRARRTALVHTDCVRYFPEFTRPLPPDQAGDHFIGAYAFLTEAEHAEYEGIRRREPSVTLPPPEWARHPLLKKIHRKLKDGVQRITHGCRWCL